MREDTATFSICCLLMSKIIVIDYKMNVNIMYCVYNFKKKIWKIVDNQYV